MGWTDVYPRPQMRRESWQSLCGEWIVNGEPSCVPSCRTEEELFYSRSFDFKRENDIVLLHFEAVDQIAEVSLNGVDLGRHFGGYLPFEFDISSCVKNGENLLEVHVIDRLDHTYPYGKQRKDRGGMWYTPMSGIWQSVWIEQVSEDYIRSVRITPDLNGVSFEIECPCRAQISFSGMVYESGGQLFHSENKMPETGSESPDSAASSYQNIRIEIEDPHLWTPDDPFLYSAKICAGRDQVEIYFALRTVDIRSIGGINRVCLNGDPVFLHGVLDQGYFDSGLMLPPDPEEYCRDILRMKELGFNMLRKHIKIEPQLFYYECDRQGMLVMQDMVNSGDYSFWRDTILPTIGASRSDLKNKLDYRMKYFVDHCKDTVSHLYNHPCIVAWTIFNEGWGQFNSDEMYDRFKEWDGTRLTDSTSGWFAQKKSDFDSRHIYFRTPNIKKGGKDGRPLLISECGGYSLDLREGSGRTYGYGKCKDIADLTEKIVHLYEKMIVPAISIGCCGCVYTQLSDIEDEINGLYSYDRNTCKTDKDRIRELSDRIKRSFAPCADG